MIKLPKIKRGDTLVLTQTYFVDEVPTDITDITIKSQLRTVADVLVVELTATKLDQTAYPGVFTLTLPEGGALTVGNLYCDIEFSDSFDVVKSTETFIIPVEKDITHV